MVKAKDITRTLFFLLVVSVFSNNCYAFHVGVPATTTTTKQQRIPFKGSCSSGRFHNNILKVRHDLKAVEDENAEQDQASESSSSQVEVSNEISSSVTTEVVLPRQVAQTTPSNNNPMANNPLVQGEVTMDGSLIVLIPAAVIGIGGFILSIIVAMNSADEIVQTLNASIESLEIKPRNEQSVDNTKCRGLCSSQQDDLKELQTFMQGLSGSRGGINAASVDIQTALDADTTTSTTSSTSTSNLSD